MVSKPVEDTPTQQSLTMIMVAWKVLLHYLPAVGTLCRVRCAASGVKNRTRATRSSPRAFGLKASQRAPCHPTQAPTCNFRRRGARRSIRHRSAWPATMSLARQPPATRPTLMQRAAASGPYRPETAQN